MARRSTDTEARIRNVSPGLRFFLTATLCVVLMVLDHRGDYLTQIRSRAGDALYPLQVAIDAPFSGVRWARENLALHRQLVAENAVLREESLVAGARLQQLAALEAENARLRSLLDARSRVPDRVLVGEILSVDMDPLRHRVVVNRGSRDGVYDGQALIDSSGIVGQVTRSRLSSAEALLITDPDHAVPVALVRTGLRTIAVGTGDTGRLSLPFLTRNADVVDGDPLVTSGLGGTFPPGYPVGAIELVDDTVGDAFLEVTARPAADLDRLHELLFVFRADGESGDGSADPVTEAAAPAAATPGDTAPGSTAPDDAAAESPAAAPATDTPAVDNPETGR